MSEVADSTEARSQSLKPALFTEHSNTDKMKKRRTVADSVANIGKSGDRDRCLGTSVAYLGAPSYVADAGKAPPVVQDDLSGSDSIPIRCRLKMLTQLD